MCRKSNNCFYLLRWLLIATLVIQPMAFANTMVAMDLRHQHTQASDFNSENVHHPNAHHLSLKNELQNNVTHTDQAPATSADPLADIHCCSTTACSSALGGCTTIAANANVQHEHFAAHQSSWQSIALPLEIKPPRSL